MDELNLSQFISDLEINLGYSMQSNSNIENTIPIIESNLQPSSSALSPPSSSSSSNPIVQPKSIKKRQRYSVETKRKILHMLETNTQQKVEELVNFDRRVIGR